MSVIARFMRYKAERQEYFADVDEAIAFLGRGEDQGTLAAEHDAIVTPDGRVLLSRDEVLSQWDSGEAWARLQAALGEGE